MPVLRPSLALLCLLLASCGGGGGSSPGGEAGGQGQSLMLSLPAAGLGPAALALIVAEGDPLSEAVASAYASARGVPATNLLRVKLDAANEAISAEAFTALRADLEARMPAAAQASLITWARPSRVEGACSMGITAALTLGFDAKYCNPTPGCAATASSPYYDSESRQPVADHRLRPSMLLGPRSLEAARSLIERGLSADQTRPTGEGWLVRSNDNDRSTRATDMAPLPAAWGSALKLNYLDNTGGPASANQIANKSGVMFYFNGLARLDTLTSLAPRPGAIGDSLTSVAARLPSTAGQTPVLDWLAAGFTASYGTVEEPCNFTQKFPRVSVLLDHYARGATLVEAYWKSVQWPGQGLFVGDPLAQPWQDSNALSIVGGEYQLKTRNLRPGARYALQYRLTNAGGWTSLAEFTGQRGQALDARVPLPPAAAVQLRWTGPCVDKVTDVCTLASSP